MKQNVIRLKDLNIPVRYFKLHNKKLRRFAIVDKNYKSQQIEIFVYYSQTMFAATYLKLIIKDNKYSVTNSQKNIRIRYINASFHERIRNRRNKRKIEYFR